jgi:hypothetical protein
MGGEARTLRLEVKKVAFASNLLLIIPLFHLKT